MRLIILFSVIVTLLPCVSSAAVTQAKNPNKAVAMKPNIDISTYRRCYAVNEKITINLQTFNVRSVHFSAYKMDLGKIVSTSAVMDNFTTVEAKLNINKLPIAAQWRSSSGEFYIDQWADTGAAVPTLTPGAYLIVATAAGVEKRTWLAVTNADLLTKRSDRELLIFVNDIIDGSPLAGVKLTVTDRNGKSTECLSGHDGIVRLPLSVPGNVWIEGETDRGPVFDLAGEATAPDPFTIYTVTDRPVYRPGALLHFTSTIRRKAVAPESPSRIQYESYANSPAIVEFRDSTDALIERRAVTTNAFGSVEGSFPLASECGQGNWHVNVVIGTYTSYATFVVQSYRKPEMMVSFAFDQAHYLCGATAHAVLNAQYYYGRPVASATVKYSVQYDGSAGSYESVGTTDAQGQLKFDLPTKRAIGNDQEMSITASVTDLSRRSISSSANTLIAAGAYHLTIDAEKNYYRTGQPITMILNASDYDDKPVSAQVKVIMSETKEDNQHRAYTETTTKDVTIGANGEGKATFSSLRPGELDFTVTGYDDQKDKIEAETTVEVSDHEQQPQAIQSPSLTISTDKQRYVPGQTAALLIDTTLVGIKYAAATKSTPQQPAHRDAWALLTVEGEELGTAELIHLTSKDTTVKIPLTAVDFPSVEAHVEVIQDHIVTDQDTTIIVDRKQQELNVGVVPDKPCYRPGDSATYTITTTDYLGRPAPAEVSLGVVDASIYDIEPENSPDIESYFYGDQEVRIETDFSFAAQYSGGGYQNIPPAPGSPTAFAASPIHVRNNFLDTAFWSPSVVTGSNGIGVVHFTVPDNLTTWRATAHAISLKTSIGSASNDVIAVMPLLVKLELPRFVVAGDISVFSAIVQNGTKQGRSVTVSATANGATMVGQTVQTIELAPGAQRRFDWKASVTGEGSATVDVVADGGSGGQDAAEGTVPIDPAGLKMVTASSYELSDANPSQDIDLTKVPAGTQMTVTLSSSLAGSLADTVDELIRRPDGDAECAASGLAADIAAGRALKAEGLPERRDVQKDISLTLQTLYLYQHPDGGWNWWEFDQSDGDITSSVLSALLSAKAAGYFVDDQRIARGMTYLLMTLHSQQDTSSSADWLLTLARAGTKNLHKPLRDLYQFRDSLDDYGKASLSLAMTKDGTADDAVIGNQLMSEVITDSIAEGRTVSWPARAGSCPWEADDVAVTAHVLAALIQENPASPLIPQGVRWLMANRTGSGWDDSEADSLAVSAISAYLELANDKLSKFDAQASVDGQPIVDLSSHSTTSSTTITVNSAQIAGHKKLSFVRTGSGTVYVDIVESYIEPVNIAVAQANGISVDRTFEIATEDPSLSESLVSGSSMTVFLNIDANTAYRYVRIEDALPAGCEVGSEDSSSSGYPIFYSDGPVLYAQMDVRDDKVVFSLDNLPKGKTTLTYVLNTEQPGTYTILPATASLNYFPEIRGNTAAAHVVIVDQP